MKNLTFNCPTCRHDGENERIFCKKCKTEFNFFRQDGVCTSCGHTHTKIVCSECVEPSSMHDWYGNLPAFALDFSKKKISAKNLTAW
jgi:predicted amidophosphoribosyltransferase